MPEQPDRAARPHLETTAITAGRAASGDSLAPVAVPVDHVHGRHGGRARRDGRHRSVRRASTAATATPPCATSRTPSPSSRAPRPRGPSPRAWAPSPRWCSGCARRATTSSPSARSTRARTGCWPCTCPASASTSRFVDGTDAGGVRRRRASPARRRLVFAETPANPALSLVDLDEIGAIAGPMTVVDSTFATPPVQRPLDHGVDLVLHSATKGIAGHNDATLGVVAGSAELIDWIWASPSSRARTRRPSTHERPPGPPHPRRPPPPAGGDGARAGDVPRGPPRHRVGVVPGPAEPPPARAGHAPDDALAARAWSPSTWPGAHQPRSRFVERCRLARIALSLGGPETLVTHPATIAGRYTPAERADHGITDGLVRVSVGLEHPDDLQPTSPRPSATPDRPAVGLQDPWSAASRRTWTGLRRSPGSRPCGGTRRPRAAGRPGRRRGGRPP